MSDSAALPDQVKKKTIQSDIPARLDRLPWSKFHWLLVIAPGRHLGSRWTGSDRRRLHWSDAKASQYACPDRQGSWPGRFDLSRRRVDRRPVFGHLTDRLGRKRLFTVTLGIYMMGAMLTALSWNFWSFALFRCLTGMAIGGEYSAINSAIDELIPARARSSGPDCQRHLLDRCGPRGAGEPGAAQPRADAALAWLADRLRHRRPRRPGDDARSPLRSGESRAGC